MSQFYRTDHGNVTSRTIGGAAEELSAMTSGTAKFLIGQIVHHRFFPFRGVIFDVDPTFDNTEEWYDAIPEEIRPSKDQPFYHLLAENDEGPYIAYVSEQNLVVDENLEPVSHPSVDEIFDGIEDGCYVLKREHAH